MCYNKPDLETNEMRKSGHKVVVTIFAVICSLLNVSSAAPESTSSHEYRVKAAFMFQFVNFIDGWKFQQKDGENKESHSDKDKKVLIGIIGENPFKDAFEPLMEKKIRDRNIAIKKFKGFSEVKKRDKNIEVHPDIKDIQKCDMLFLCSSEKQYIVDILKPIQKERILTIADTQGFLEKGGIVNFIIERNRVRFEVNVIAAKRANLVLRSKLLRLATRVIMEDKVEEK